MTVDRLFLLLFLVFCSWQCASSWKSARRKHGSHKFLATSCKAILENSCKNNRRSLPSGAYYIKTKPTVTKVYCYMDDIPGCGGGGWTTIIKTNGNKPNFRYDSCLWTTKFLFEVENGQTGLDGKETKLPTYWTLPFTKLCLGMTTSLNKPPKWILLNYRASSLFSVIADGSYRKFTIGRAKWKSLISGSSLQRNCNREGFNARGTVKNHATARIGIVSNQENNCHTPDSYIGFGTGGTPCGLPGDVFTGNGARCGGDNGNKAIKAFGYILAQ